MAVNNQKLLQYLTEQRHLPPGRSGRSIVTLGKVYTASESTRKTPVKIKVSIYVLNIPLELCSILDESEVGKYIHSTVLGCQ